MVVLSTMTVSRLQAQEEIIGLSRELKNLWKDWSHYKRRYDEVTQFVWWHQNGSRIHQIQSRVNKLRHKHCIPCYRTSYARRRIFFPVGH
jgi:hypothetical protein